MLGTYLSLYLVFQENVGYQVYAWGHRFSLCILLNKGPQPFFVGALERH